MTTQKTGSLAPDQESEPPKHYCFVLFESYSALSLVSALATLNNANLVANREVYTWELVSVDPAGVLSSVGQNTENVVTFDNAAPDQNVVVVAGGNAYDTDLGRFKTWLARNVRGGVRLTALGTAAIVLARLEYLDDVEVAVHPCYQVGFTEHFTSAALCENTHVSDGLRCSASGGTSSIDLFLDFIEQDFGYEFSSSVAESMCYVQTRLLQRSTDVLTPSSHRVLNPIVARAVASMEKNLEYPISPSVLAKELGISTRQLERLFQRYVGTSPKRHYTSLRLREAYRLIVQNKIDLTQVALITGFASPSHFSKCFRGQFGMSPHELRNQRH